MVENGTFAEEMMPDALSPNVIPLAKPASVRLADHRDEAQLYALLCDLHAHNNAGWKFPFRPELVLGRIETGTRPDPQTRSNPQDQRRGIIGVIGEPGQRLIGSVGLFIEPVAWFSDMPSVLELWLYVRPEARGAPRHYERDLFAFSLWVHATLKADLGPNYRMPFQLHTGFVHRGKHFAAMERVWSRLCGGQRAGVLFIIG